MSHDGNPLSGPDQDPDPVVSRRFAQAVAAVDREFGTGYARENPQLIASLVQSATIEAAVATGHGAHREALGLAERMGQEVCDTLLKLKPKLFG
jgi:hypothetical protein